MSISKATEAQNAAAEPLNSVFVSANAGSGKTRVLTNRVIRLLLNGTEPAKILCLTYTKAAAAVMQKRIFETLSNWTECDDADLALKLQQIEGKMPKPNRLTQARRLFAHALETPGGLKIQTIHAFCESLLHQFPLEANIVGHFEMMDDLQRQELIAKSRQSVLIAANSKQNQNLYHAYMLVLKTVGENGFNILQDEAIGNRYGLKEFLQEHNEEQQIAYLNTILNIKKEDNKESLVQSLKQIACLDSTLLQEVSHYKHKSTQEFIEKMTQLAKADNDIDILALAKSAYFTDKGPRSISRLFAKDFLNSHPELENILLEKQQLLLKAFEKYVSLELIPLNLAAYQLIAVLLNTYEGLKKSNGLMDFDDLIHYTLKLLQRDRAGLWVQYKLDRGIDHILVDEAQDTSPEQWQIIQILAQEFFTGLGQRDITRTIFAVGDEKQSIYSFQGAVPEDFDKNGRLIANSAAKIHQTFKKLRLDYSFRSTKDILQAVDLVFEQPENYQGLTAENIKTVHEAIRIGDSGEVELWDIFTPEKMEEPEDWRQPVDQLQAPAMRLAKEIAKRIDFWLTHKEILKGQDRAMKASDILILVQQRDQFVPALARELKNRQVPVSGADRLHLTNHIAVRDLLALGRFVLQSHDDLSLACILKSPLFNLTEDDLYHLAYRRKTTLWQRLKEMSLKDERFKTVYSRLKTYQALADTVPVFEFYSTILSKDGGRVQFLARLGIEASEVLDAFMDYSLSLQQTGQPGLHYFIETISKAKPEIKRELDQNREEVRIMTVHGAKGLEAPVVFLIDAGKAIWNHHHAPKLLPISNNQQRGYLWQPNKDYAVEIAKKQIEILKLKKNEEYRRLLYVALTRAEDRLVICGYRGQKTVENTFAPLITQALKPYAKEIKGPCADITAWRFCVTEQLEKSQKAEKKPDNIAPMPPFPSYFFTKMAEEAPQDQTISVSQLAQNLSKKTPIATSTSWLKPLLSLKDNSQDIARQRGIIIHKLLQYLPQFNEDEQQERLLHYLKNNPCGWNLAEQQHIASTILNLIQDKSLNLLFSQKAQSEIALMSEILWHQPQNMLTGQIDRLYISPEDHIISKNEGEIIFCDFKTGKVPENAQKIISEHKNQIALYYYMLQQIYPQKTIKAWLIYTQSLDKYCLDNAELVAIVDRAKKVN